MSAAGGDGGYPEASLVLHWNGGTWAQVRVPSIGALDAVTVTSANVWVAGGNKVERFNGSAWTSLPALPGSVAIAGLAHTAAGLWAVGHESFSCGEGGSCTSSYTALWNGSTWTAVPAGGATGLSGVVASGSAVLATGGTGVWQLSTTAATPQVTPTQNPPQLTAIGAGARTTESARMLAAQNRVLVANPSQRRIASSTAAPANSPIVRTVPQPTSGARVRP